MNFASKSITGKRSRNEDCALILQTERVQACAVSDGMGGHAAGEMASKTAVESLQDWLGVPDAEPVSLLRRAFLQANDKVYTLSYSDPSMFGMGCTLVAAMLHPDTFYAANVGDSRLYLFHGNTIRQITKDHSFVAELVMRGIITPEEAKTHPRRNLITRAIGTDESVEVDLFCEDWKAGDILLLCSDGLCGVLTDAQLASHLMDAADLSAACDSLVQHALDAGSTDNITVVLAQNEGGAQ